MPPWVRIILIIVAIGFLAVVIAIFLGYRYMESHKDELLAVAREEKAEGRKTGEGKPPGVCIDAALARVQQDDTFRGNVRTRVFEDACLKAATPSPDFCANVPAGLIDFAKWSAAECERRGMTGKQGCAHVLNAVHDYCHPR